IPVPVEMRSAQKRLYDAVRSEAKRQLLSLNVSDRLRLRALAKSSAVRLIQVTSDPALLVGSTISGMDILKDALAEGPSPKIVRACSIARELAHRGHKCIIWS